MPILPTPLPSTGGGAGVDDGAPRLLERLGGEGHQRPRLLPPVRALIYKYSHIHPRRLIGISIDHTQAHLVSTKIHT